MRYKHNKMRWGIVLPITHGKVKHIDIQHHYIRDLVKSGAITIEQVPSSDNPTDILTKSLPCNHHHHLLASLNIT